MRQFFYGAFIAILVGCGVSQHPDVPKIETFEVSNEYISVKGTMKPGAVHGMEAVKKALQNSVSNLTRH